MPGRWIVLATVVALLAPSALSAGTSPSAGSVHGVVTLMPARPVCIEGRPCGKPAAGVVLRFSRDGKIVGRATTSAAGSYRIRLAPGGYSVSIAPESPRRVLSPRLVRVASGRSIRADFELDTGMQ
ncbi:MAG: carboxypeptidase regulatory-like domain-containing protein [Actinobacteria bacterium]|nr:carboxypeptidase regulatory-like domain-containing protein [Actinomycetota bacterium]